MKTCCACLNHLNANNNQIPGAFACQNAHASDGMCKSCMNKMLAHRGVGAKCPMCRADFKTNIDARVLLEDVRVLQRFATGLLFRLVKVFGPAVDTNRNVRNHEQALVRHYEQLERYEAMVNNPRKNVSFASRLRGIASDLLSVEQTIETAERGMPASVLNTRTATAYMLERYPEIPFTMTRESKNKITKIYNRPGY